MTLRASAAAKINLSLVVGPRREDGLHELVSVVQRVDLSDRLELEPDRPLEVIGFAEDTLVRQALAALAAVTGAEPRWRVRLEKRIPVAAGLGGGSADAATALVLANRTLASPLEPERLLEIAASVGSDVPFFLEPGPKVVEGVGELLHPIELPQDFWVVLARDPSDEKLSTGTVYGRFDALNGADGFAERRSALQRALASVRRPRDLARLPPNDLAAAAPSELPERLLRAGAFRADVTGAGPTSYGLFHHRTQAEVATRRMGPGVNAVVVAPVW